MADETLENKRIDQLPQSAGVTPGSFLAMWNGELARTERIETSVFVNESSTQNFEWLSDTAYLEDDVVTRGGVWYQALADNTNIIPGTDPGTWLAIPKSSSGLVPWAAGVYTDEKVFVMYDANQDDSDPNWSLYALKNPPVRPYVSVDFPAELLAGDWVIAAGGGQSDARGDWADDTDLPDTGDNGTGPGGAPARGNRWRLTAGIGIYGIGTIAEAAVTSPGQDLTNWIFYAVQP